MLNIIVFKGGLGNQMFQYAFYLAHKKYHRWNFYLFDTKQALTSHHGFELNRLFPIRIRFKDLIYKFIVFFFPNVLNHSGIYHDCVEQKFDNFIFYKKRKVCVFDGYWQTEYYFQDIEMKVREAFSFNLNLLNDNSIQCMKEMQNNNSVSIHIRRGDYLKSQNKNRLTFGIDYYIDSIIYLNSKLQSPVYYIFSDDKSFIEQLRLPIVAHIIDWNIDNDSWQDMFLMSQCKHNIIANSSFSWWGAWLNKNPNKIVIAPKLWIDGFYNEDIVPQKWVRL